MLLGDICLWTQHTNLLIRRSLLFISFSCCSYHLPSQVASSRPHRAFFKMFVLAASCIHSFDLANTSVFIFEAYFLVSRPLHFLLPHSPTCSSNSMSIMQLKDLCFTFFYYIRGPRRQDILKLNICNLCTAECLTVSPLLDSSCLKWRHDCPSLFPDWNVDVFLVTYLYHM